MSLFKRIPVAVIAILAFQFIISCNEKKENINVSKQNLNKKPIEKTRVKPAITFTIDFPDTVYVNQSNNGTVQYESILDSITTKFGDKYNNRYSRFILTTTNNVDYDRDYLKQHVKDTFGALNNRTIPFYNIKFKKTGTYYIDGLIDDLILIDLFKKDKDGEDLLRLLEYDERVTKKVVVINKG